MAATFFEYFSRILSSECVRIHFSISAIVKKKHAEETNTLQIGISSRHPTPNRKSIRRLDDENVINSIDSESPSKSVNP